jgi:hypothetical protein
VIGGLCNTAKNGRFVPPSKESCQLAAETAPSQRGLKPDEVDLRDVPVMPKTETKLDYDAASLQVTDIVCILVSPDGIEPSTL